MDPCQSIDDQIRVLRAQEQQEKNDLRDDPGDVPARKPLGAKINEIHRRYAGLIADKQRAYDRCRLQHGGQPDREVTLAATVTLTTDHLIPAAQGPFSLGTSIRIVFLKYDHRRFEIRDFPKLEAGLENTITVTLEGVQSASANPANGKLSATLDLLFSNSLEVTGESRLSVTVSTDNAGGSRINPRTRRVALAGKGRFSSGFFNDRTGRLVVGGTLSALP
jgi:hypothetical protein